ncbi:MAG: hypothetical protein AB7N91_22930 [Candidatus Tectimicrobiota bacterium]
MTVGAAGHTYQALDRQQAAAASQGADTISVDDLKQALGALENVTITTLEKIGGDIAATAHRTTDDLGQMFSAMGDDLVRGDFFGALGDLFQGGEHVARDLFHGAANVYTDAAQGAAQILVAVLKLAGKTLIFGLEHAGQGGKFLAWLLEQVGIALEKFLDWLAKVLGWEDSLYTHDVIRDLLNHGLDAAVTRVSEITAGGDHLRHQVEDNMSSALASAIQRYGGVPEQQSRFSNELSEATAWLIHCLSTHADQAQKIPHLSNVDPFAGPFGEIMTILEAHLGTAGDKVCAAIGAAGSDFEQFMHNRDRPALLIAALLEITKALASVGMEVVRAVWDLLMSMFAGVVRALKDILNEEWEVPFLSDLYAFLTRGRKLSLLSVVSLIVAIPATLQYKSMFHNVPFQTSVEFAMGLASQPGRIVAAGAMSAATQFVMMFTNVASAVTQVLTFDFDPSETPPSERPSSLAILPTAITYMDLALGILAHGLPLPGG